MFHLKQQVMSENIVPMLYKAMTDSNHLDSETWLSAIQMVAAHQLGEVSCTKGGAPVSKPSLEAAGGVYRRVKVGQYHEQFWIMGDAWFRIHQDGAIHSLYVSGFRHEPKYPIETVGALLEEIGLAKQLFAA